MIEIIAELGSNPAPGGWRFGDYCAAAARAGASQVKVQLFRAEHFPEAERESKRAFEFPRERLAEFVKTAHDYRLKAVASVFDAAAVRLAAPMVDWLKLGAREQRNDTLRLECLAAHSKYDRLTYRSVSDFDCFTSWGNELPLFAIQQYPAPLALSLLRAFQAARSFEQEGLGMRWGWSSHTAAPGWLDGWLAARLGASVVEKHLCLGRGEPEGGHSLMPDEFGRMAGKIQIPNPKSQSPKPKAQRGAG